MAKKSIVEEALLEAKQLEEALKKNSKEILAATMKQDIDEMVKASLYEGDEMAEEVEELENESQMEGSEDESSTMVMDEEMETEMTDETEETQEVGESMDEEFGDEESGESVDMDSEEMGDETGEEGVEDMEMDFDTEDTAEETDDTDVIDMTDASPEELISVFKKMSDDDEIEVVKTGNNVNLKDNKTGAEYMIKMDESMNHEDEDETFSYDEMMDFDEIMHGDEDEGADKIKSSFRITSGDESECDECGWQEGEDQEPIYEITFEDDDDDEDEMDFDLMDVKPIKKMPKDISSEFDDDDEVSFDFDSEDSEEDLEDEDEKYGSSDEGTRRTLADRRKVAIHPQNYPSSRMDESVKSEYKKVIKEYNDLKDKYVQTKDALKVFRDKLGEIALFNSNLTHAVKLFMEHATTKTEKTAIMRRFDDEAVTLKESKRLYKTITNELKDRKPISEKVEKKINESLTKGSSDTLIESKVYIDPQISKIHSLIDRLENRK